jgi:aspartyl aminopeptidase
VNTRFVDQPSDPADDVASLMVHLDASVSPRHSVAHAVRVLASAGFVGVEDLASDPPPLGFLARAGLLVAWVRGDVDRFRVAGAHTDSPCLRIKPRPDLAQHGWRQWGVEVYGGILNNSWLDRDLGVAGVAIDADGREHLVRSPGAVARVPQLAVHLDRDVNERGLVLDRQQHLLPVVGLGEDGARFEDLLADWSGVTRGSIRSFEISMFDVQPAARLGVDGDLLASGRIDNQVSCWASIRALLERASTNGGPTAVVALFDHEEVGSDSTTGAAGPWLEWILERLHGGSRHSLHDALSRSACLSVDCAHGVHPNYPERHDPINRPRLDQGPVLKINANQRYATSAETAALFARSCEAAGLPWQTFVSRNNVPCGSTIGPLASTRLGVPTADVGLAQLSMHSARELCGTHDPTSLRRAIASFFAQP